MATRASKHRARRRAIQGLGLGLAALALCALLSSPASSGVDDHDDRVDLGDATLMPGLIDLHTHLTDAEDAYWEQVLVTTTPAEAALYGAANALTTLRSGFTTVRDMGPAWSFTDVDLRNIIDEGTLPGPRMMVAGNYVSATGGAGDARGCAAGAAAQV